jgi:pimeloyl-ACP methyl ester carboxylesterase
MRESTVDLGDVSLHMLDAGKRGGRAILFLHGWPQNSLAFAPVMAALADEFHVVAIDLPGVGRSAGRPRAADKRTLASYVRALIKVIGLTNATLVGHDVGGQIVYAYLRDYSETIARAAILDVAVPGVAPWADVVRNPHIWHFAFHAVAELPELLVHGHEAAYFDFFFNAISANPAAIGPQRRRVYAEAYRSVSSLAAGFDWYRAFPKDEKDNAGRGGSSVSTPLLYIRGDAEGGDIQTYLAGLRASGLVNVTGKVIANCGHFSPDEQPQALADALRSFVSDA